jgi:hypothetical protein
LKSNARISKSEFQKVSLVYSTSSSVVVERERVGAGIEGGGGENALPSLDSDEHAPTWIELLAP